MVGDAQVGKTTLMVKYVENKFDEEYIMTLGEPWIYPSIIVDRFPREVPLYLSPAFWHCC